MAKILSYRTMRDSRVRVEHAALDGITKNSDDKFWDNYYPPNGFRCRCEVDKVELNDNETETSNEKIKSLNLLLIVPILWRFNAAKEKKVFSKRHPYFRIESEDKDFAKSNFGLPLPA